MENIYNAKCENDLLMMKNFDSKRIKKITSYYLRRKYINYVYFCINEFNIRLDEDDVNYILEYVDIDVSILDKCDFTENNIFKAINFRRNDFAKKIIDNYRNYNLYFFYAAGTGNIEICKYTDKGEIEYFNSLLNASKSGNFEVFEYILDKIQLDDVQIKIITNYVSTLLNEQLILLMLNKNIQVDQNIVISYFGRKILL